jgi:hypothetical protein
MTNDSLPANMAWFLVLAASLPAQPPPDITIPDVKPIFGEIPRRFEKYDVVLEPDKNERDKQGVFWLAARMRTADSPRGNRGYEIRILRSADCQLRAPFADHRSGDGTVQTVQLRRKRPPLPRRA